MCRVCGMFPSFLWPSWSSELHLWLPLWLYGSRKKFWWRSLGSTFRNGTSQGETKEGRTGHQPWTSGGWRRECVCCLPHLWHISNTLLARNCLPSDWQNEGKGWQRRVLPVCSHVGFPRCGLEVQGAGITALHSKLWATGENRTKTPGPGAQSALSACLFWDEDWANWECPPIPTIPTDSTRRKGGGSSWSPSVNRTSQIIFC